jgi:hypothetical protein
LSCSVTPAKASNTSTAMSHSRMLRSARINPNWSTDVLILLLWRNPAVSTNTYGRSANVNGTSTESRVVPATSLTIVR